MKIHVSTLVFILIVVYVMLFEWRNLLLAYAIQPTVYAAKFIIPVLLFLAIPLVKPYSQYLTLFMFFFASFMLWGLIPSLFTNYYPETIIQWFTFLPRLLFSLLVGIYFLRKPEASFKVVKFFIVIGVLIAIQYFLLEGIFLLGKPKAVYFPNAKGVFYGPYGMLGNQAAIMYFPNVAFPVLSWKVINPCR